MTIAEPTPPAETEDLRPWGYAPGWYMFDCIDCPADISMMARMARAAAKRSWRCREHAIAARAAAPAAPEPIYVIWWTTQTDCEMVLALGLAEDADRPFLTPGEWPDWLRDQFLSRCGRAGRARLWNAFADTFKGGVAPWPNNRVADFLTGTGGNQSEGDRHCAGGIVVPLGDLNLVIGLPGFVTTAGLTRLQIHGVDLDL